MRIGLVADAAGVEPSAIRFYESQGLLPPPDRTPAGYRDYTPMVLERLRFITAARALDLGLDDIAEILELRDNGDAPCAYVRRLLENHAELVAQRMKELRQLQRQLDELRDRAAELSGTAPTDCICHLITP